MKNRLKKEKLQKIAEILEEEIQEVDETLEQQKKIAEGMSEFKRVAAGIVEAVDKLRDEARDNISINNFDELSVELKSSLEKLAIKEPLSVKGNVDAKISNFPARIKVEPVEVKEPGWLGKLIAATKLDWLGKEITSSLEKALDKFRKPDRAIAVKLVSTGNGFYNAIMNAVSGGGYEVVGIKNAAGDRISPYSEVSTPTIYNKSMASENTEYSQALPAGTRKVAIKMRDLAYEIKLSFTENESGTKYITIPVGSTMEMSGINLSGKTLYFQSSGASQVCEILVWT